MSVEKRGAIWHYDFTVNGERHRGSTRQTGKTAARKVEEQERERAKLGTLHRQELTIEDAADRWFAAKAADKKSATTTAQRIEIMLRHIGPATLLSAIDAPEVADAIAGRRAEPTRQTATHEAPRGPANATVNRDLIDTTLRPILNYALKTLKQPVNLIDWKDLRLDEPKERSHPFTPAQLSDWGGKLPSWHVPLRDFLGRYGLRLSEAFFPLSAINTETWQITVRGPTRKNGLPHIIPLLAEDARDIAARLSRAQLAKIDTVWFREMKNGSLRPIKARGYQSAAKAALKRAGMEGARPAHDLRHHAGTEIMRASGNLKVVQKLLGHENIQSTARYAHADQSDVLKALENTRRTDCGENCGDSGSPSLPQTADGSR